MAAASTPQSANPQSSSSPPPGTPTPMSDYKRRPSKLPTQPKVKRFVRPPSAGHRDVEPPSLLVVQRSLNSYLGEGVKRAKSKYVKEKTDFHDEEGRMLVKGSGGGKYAGEILGGAPHGFGEHRICSGKEPGHLLYEGEWEYGRKTGYGTVHYTNGQEYRGELVEGESCGWGCMRYNDGNVYDGEWFKGRRHGQGTLVHSSSFSWFFDLIISLGNRVSDERTCALFLFLQYYQNGNWYDGGWCKDAREGWGVFYWPKIRRKFEGEWTCNDPFSGSYSAMTPQEYELLQKRQLEFPPATLGVLEKGVPKEDIKLLLIDLRHPFSTNYVPVTRVRKCKEDHNPAKIFKRQVERRRSLSCAQIDALKHAYQVIAPGYLYRPTLLGVHLRRLLVIARIDPDLPQGENLLAHLERCAQESAKRNSTNTSCFTFSDFLFSIYRFHDP